MLLHSCTTVSSTGYSTVKPYSRYLSGLSSAGPYRTVCVSTIQSIHDIRVKDSSGGECVTALRETAERGPETQDRRDRGETATAVARHRTYQHRLCAKNAAMNTCAVVGQTSDVARWDRGHTGPRPPRAGCRGRGGTTVCITRHRIRTSSKRKAQTPTLSAVVRDVSGVTGVIVADVAASEAQTADRAANLATRTAAEAVCRRKQRKHSNQERDAGGARTSASSTHAL